MFDQACILGSYRTPVGIANDPGVRDWSYLYSAVKTPLLLTALSIDLLRCQREWATILRWGVRSGGGCYSIDGSCVLLSGDTVQVEVSYWKSHERWPGVDGCSWRNSRWRLWVGKKKRRKKRAKERMKEKYRINNLIYIYIFCFSSFPPFHVANNIFNDPQCKRDKKIPFHVTPKSSFFSLAWLVPGRRFHSS